MFVTAYKQLRMPLLVGMALATLTGMSQAEHSWGGYHWARTGNQFTLKLGDNLTNRWLEDCQLPAASNYWNCLLVAASSDWNHPEWFVDDPTSPLRTPLLTTSIVPGQSTKRTCSMIKGTTQVCNGKYGANGWLGLASINITGGTHITQGTAKMNDTYFNLATYNNPNERLHVMCQEIAHTFGLDHQSEDGKSLDTCMDYFSNTGTKAGSTLSTRPNEHDFEQLAKIYSHWDNTTTVDTSTSTAPSAADVDITDDPRSWGTLMRQSANGRSSVYERFNRDGSRTLTHVYWTFEAASSCPSCDHRFQKHEGD